MIFHLAAPEFHGIPWNIPWNSMELSDILFSGTRFPWNSLEHLCDLKWRPPNSMESRGTRWFWFGDSRVPCHSMEYSMQVNGSMVLIKMTISKFQGIPWNLVIFHLAATEFHAIPWNIPWNSMEPLCHLKWSPSNSIASDRTRQFCYLATLSYM